MPLIVPKQVKDYTSFDSVKLRLDSQMNWDIIQAEQDIFRFCGHKFDDTTKYPRKVDGTIDGYPEVQLAAIKVTEYYSLINNDESATKGYKSEKLGDYSYTVAEGSSAGLEERFSLSSLLSDHIQSRSGNFSLKVRSF